MEDLEVLTKYFDDHLKALNEWLDPDVFRNLLLVIFGICLMNFKVDVVLEFSKHKQKNLCSSGNCCSIDFLHGGICFE